MISISFSGVIVMAMHVVTIQHTPDVEGTGGSFKISLSNGLVLEEKYTNQDEAIAIAKKLAFDGSGKQP